ncbi:MAG: phosphatidylglycerophosphatase A [Candidatus Kapaibacteriales bacterium]
MTAEDNINPVSLDSSELKKHLSKGDIHLLSVIGVGFLPKAPGTWGSLAAILIFLLFYVIYDFTNLSREFISIFLLLISILLFTFSFKPIKRITEAGYEDPSWIVIDEFVAVLLGLCYYPLWSSIWNIIIFFALFRLFDIVKPWPIAKIDKINGPIGIMFDDIVATIIAAIFTQLTIFLIRMIDIFEFVLS